MISCEWTHMRIRLDLVTEKRETLFRPVCGEKTRHVVLWPHTVTCLPLSALNFLRQRATTSILIDVEENDCEVQITDTDDVSV